MCSQTPPASRVQAEALLRSFPIGKAAVLGGCVGISAWDEPSCCWWSLQFPQSGFHVPVPHSAHPKSRVPEALTVPGAGFARGVQGRNGDISLHILLLCKDQPDLARARGSRRNARLELLLQSRAQAGRRDGVGAPHRPHTVALLPRVVAGSQKSRCLARPSGQELPRAVSVPGDWVWGPSRREPWGTKGPLLRRCVLLSGGGRCEGSP